MTQKLVLNTHFPVSFVTSKPPLRLNFHEEATHLQVADVPRADGTEKNFRAESCRELGLLRVLREVQVHGLVVEAQPPVVEVRGFESVKL